jgi:hypothetical protein
MPPSRESGLRAGTCMRSGTPLAPDLNSHRIDDPLGTCMRPGTPLSPDLISKTREPELGLTCVDRDSAQRSPIPAPCRFDRRREIVARARSRAGLHHRHTDRAMQHQPTLGRLRQRAGLDWLRAPRPAARWATFMLAAGVPLRAIIEVFGHFGISVTREHLRSRAASASPGSADAIDELVGRHGRPSGISAFKALQGCEYRDAYHQRPGWFAGNVDPDMACYAERETLPER